MVSLLPDCPESYLQSAVVLTEQGDAERLSNSLRNTLKLDDLPIIKVWKDESGKIWSLDHRHRKMPCNCEGTEQLPYRYA